MSVRTTLSLDPDVAAEIEKRRSRTARSAKAEINHLLRAGLEHERNLVSQRPPYNTRTVRVGGLKISSLDSITDALAEAEQEAYK